LKGENNVGATRRVALACQKPCSAEPKPKAGDPPALSGYILACKTTNEKLATKRTKA